MNIDVSDISSQIISNIEVVFNKKLPFFGVSFNRVIAQSIGAVVILLYKRAGRIHLDQFIRTASEKEIDINGKKIIPLVEWGRLLLAGDPKQAVAAELSFDVYVNLQSGFIGIGEQIVNPLTGVIYVTTSSVSLNQQKVTVNCKAVNDQKNNGGLGSIGNMSVGEEASFVNPLSNVGQTVVVSAVIENGADGETWQEYRDRVIKYAQRKPKGGAYNDYWTWSLETPGIINSYPYTGDNPGFVDIYSEATPASSGSVDGIPTSAQLQGVYDNCQLSKDGLATRRPIGSWVNSYAITRKQLKVQVIGVTGVANEGVVKADITKAINSTFASKEPFINGLNTNPRNDTVTNAEITGIAQDIIELAGGSFTGVKMLSDSLEVSSYKCKKGEKLKSVVEFTSTSSSPSQPASTSGIYAGTGGNYPSTLSGSIGPYSKNQDIVITHLDQNPKKVWIAIPKQLASDVSGVVANGGLPATWTSRDETIDGKVFTIFLSPTELADDTLTLEIRWNS